MSKDVDLSNFDPDQIDPSLMSEYDSDVTVVDGLIEVTSSQSNARQLGQFVIPAGFYIKDAHIDANGDLILEMSDLTNLNAGSMSIDRTIDMELEGTGLFVGVSDNKFLFEEPSIDYPAKIENGAIKVEVVGFDPSLYSCFREVLGNQRVGRYFGAWNKRDLNEITCNNLNLAFNEEEAEITLPVGKYYVRGYSQEYRAQYVFLGLYSITDLENPIIEGVSSHSGRDSNVSVATPYLEGFFEIEDSPKVVVLANRHTANTHTNDNGMGIGPETSSIHRYNLFSQLEIWRIDDE